MDRAAFRRGGFPDEKADRDADLDFILEYVVTLATTRLPAGPGITFKIYDIYLTKLFGSNFAEAIIVSLLDEAVVGDERDHPVISETIRGPTKKTSIHVIQLRLLGDRLLNYMYP